MKKVINIAEARFILNVKKGFRRWKEKFKKDFGPETRLSSLPTEAISFLAEGRGESVLYLYDLIMNIRELGSCLDFDSLNPNEKIFVIDQYIFLLDQIRFECMKRIGWIESYPAESYPIAVMIRDFEKIAPFIQAKPPALSPRHPGYKKYEMLSLFDKETFIRQLIPKALKQIKSLKK